MFPLSVPRAHANTGRFVFNRTEIRVVSLNIRVSVGPLSNLSHVENYYLKIVIHRIIKIKYPKKANVHPVSRDLANVIAPNK